jgi:CRISPR/Cas system-associated exonuclease Cas4 (RecB family)
VDENEDEILDTYAANEDEFDPDEFAQSLIRTAQNHLETFFQVVWPQFDSQRYITHEQTFSFDVDRHTVWVRPDFCTRDQDDDFIVTDWKTGPMERFSEPTLQVLAYGLWAYEEYEPDLDRVLIQLVHTSRGEFDRTRLDEGDLDRIKDQIRADREDWTTFWSKGEFQPEPEANKCQSCEFLSRCDAGQTVLDKKLD